MRTVRPLVLLLALGLVGCGGSHNNAVPALAISGQVTLPAGTALALGSLSVVTPTGTYRVRNDGSFQAGEPAEGMAAVLLTDATGRVILMGHADANDPTAAVVNAEETAVALLLDALVGFLPSYEYLPEVRELVRDATQTGDLAAVISARVSADPLALSKGDAAIIAAITDAINALVTAAGSAQARSALAVAMRPAAADGSVWITKDITPATQQSGLLLQQTTDTNAVQFTNYFRRHAFWRAYRTGYTGADGDPQQVVPWEEVAAGYQDRYLQATTGLDGVLGTLISLVGSQIPYAPSPGWPFDLPRLPADANESAYKIIVVGASFRGGAVESQLPADAGLTAQQRQDLLTDCSLAVAATAFMDMAMPIICTVIPADALTHAMTNKQQAKLIQALVTAQVKLTPAFASELATGDVKGACTQIVLALANNSAAREAMIQVLTSEKFLQAAITSEMTQAMGDAIAKKCSLYLALADGLMTAFDLGVVTKDLSTADAVALWTAKSVSPDVTLSPAASTIKRGETVDLTCEVTAGLKGTLEYEWSAAGGHGHLTDAMGHSGVAFTSSRPAVTFVADEDLAVEVTDPVEVKVYRRNGSSRAYVGTANATVKIGGQWVRATNRTVVWGPIAFDNGPGWGAVGNVALIAVWRGPWQDYEYVCHKPGLPDEQDTWPAIHLKSKAKCIEHLGQNYLNLADDEVCYQFGGGFMLNSTKTRDTPGEALEQWHLEYPQDQMDMLIDSLYYDRLDWTFDIKR